MKSIFKLNDEKIYKIGMFFLLIYSWFFFSNIINPPKLIENLILICSILPFLFIILKSNYTHKEMILILIILLILFISSLLSNEKKLFMAYLSILSAKNINIKKIIKEIIIFNFFMLIFHTFLTITNIIPEKIEFYTSNKNILRHSFNLRHPNYLAAIMFWLTAGYIYLNQYKKKRDLIIICIIMMLLTQYITYSRTTLLIYILLILFLFLYKFKYLSQVLNIAKIFLILIIFSSILIGINYGNLIQHNEIYIKINTLISNRLYLNYARYNKYGCTLFGRNIYSIVETLDVDSLYFTCLIHYGLIHLIILTFTFIKIKITPKNILEYFLFILLLLIGIGEKYIVSIVISFPLLFIWNFIKDKENDQKKGECK